jgi:hypothetical protein
MERETSLSERGIAPPRSFFGRPLGMKDREQAEHAKSLSLGG